MKKHATFLVKRTHVRFDLVRKVPFSDMTPLVAVR